MASGMVYISLTVAFVKIEYPGEISNFEKTIMAQCTELI